MAKTKNKNSRPTEEIINVKNTLSGSVYSQIVSMTITGEEACLEFIYINPRVTEDGSKEAHVVSRITMPVRAFKEIPSVINGLIEVHESKNKDK